MVYPQILCYNRINKKCDVGVNVPVVINCKQCSKELFVKPYQVGKKSYCSRECMKKAYTKTRLKRDCKMCGKEFEFPDRPSRKNAMFCSRCCMDKYYVGERHRNYTHGYGNRMLPEKRKEIRTRHYLANKEDYYKRSFIGKIKRRNVEQGHTFEQWIDLLKKHDNTCYYCGVRMTKKQGAKQRTRDHIIPISKGGTDDISNIVPACRSCNSKKGTKTIDELEGVTVIETTSTDGRE